MLNRKIVVSLAVLLAASMVSTASWAGHSWGKYKWKPASVMLSLELGDNLDATWTDHLRDAIYGAATLPVSWNNSVVVEAKVVTGLTTGALCEVNTGTVQVCNANYGDTGWLGIAQIQTSRGTTIVAGLAKQNDYYFDQPAYNTVAWRQMVMCQEVAHTFGLGHQDENFGNTNLGSCMDYTSNPLGPPNNTMPNDHDFAQLEAIYGGGGGGGGCNPKSPKCNPSTAAGGHAEFGLLVSGHGGIEVYEKNLGNGRKLVTQVTWTLEHAENHRH